MSLKRSARSRGKSPEPLPIPALQHQLVGPSQRYSFRSSQLVGDESANPLDESTLEYLGQTVKISTAAINLSIGQAFSSAEHLYGTIIDRVWAVMVGVLAYKVNLFHNQGIVAVPIENCEVLSLEDERSLGLPDLWGLNTGEELPNSDVEISDSEDESWCNQSDASDSSIDWRDRNLSQFVDENGDAANELGLYADENGDWRTACPSVKFGNHMWNSASFMLPERHWAGGETGPTTRDHHLNELPHFFKKYWPPHVVRRIVNMTNLYAATTKPNGSTRGGDGWYAITDIEFFAWMGVCILMGVKKLPSKRHYWMADNEFFRCRVIMRVMSGNRWEAILHCLHLVDNRDVVTDKTNVDYDRLAKVRWLVEVHNNFHSQFWNAEQLLTVDEMMIKYTGKYSPDMKQYMAAKPTKYGIKVWALCNASSKFVQRIEIYTGSQGGSSEESGTGYGVVTHLLRGFEMKGHIVVCDNFFTSAHLFYDLLERGIYATGTARTDRKGFPDAVAMKVGEERGTIRYRMHVSNEICAMSWVDKKPVHFLSTSANPIDPDGNTFVYRWVEGARRLVPTSPILIQYQQYIRGVDVADQLRGYYTCQTRDHKWWHRPFFFLLDTSMVNSYIMYRASMVALNKRPLSHMMYNVQVAENLTAPFVALRQTAAPEAQIVNPNNIHYILKSPRRRCCRTCGKRQRYFCPTCRNVPVCLGACFVAMHSRR